MNTTIKSRTTSTMEEATHLGARIEFRHSLENGQELPTSVNAVAYITGGGMVNVNTTKIGNNVSPTVTFANGASIGTNAQLADDVVNKCKEIMDGGGE